MCPPLNPRHREKCGGAQSGEHHANLLNSGKTFVWLKGFLQFPTGRDEQTGWMEKGDRLLFLFVLNTVLKNQRIWNDLMLNPPFLRLQVETTMSPGLRLGR